jgi:hypothetical protein
VRGFLAGLDLGHDLPALRVDDEQVLAARRSAANQTRPWGRRCRPRSMVRVTVAAATSITVSVDPGSSRVP